jgi:DNA-binding MarR family transcriptional regulator
MSEKKTNEKQTACDAADRILSEEKQAAWLGFLRAHSLITKALDADLIANFGLQLSAFEVLSRLEDSEDGRMRMSDLADQALLSQSRVSRLCTELESRGLIERQSCASDNRVVYAAVTGAGIELLRKVEESHFEGIDRHFFGGLDDADVKKLTELWPRVIESVNAARSPR